MYLSLRWSFAGRLLFACIIFLHIGPTAHAQDAPAPPYLTAGTNHVLVGVVWDEAVVRKHLPANIQPVKEMTGLINIYQVADGYGISPYAAAYFSVDVEGFDSASGVKGRWIMQGVYGPHEITPAAMRKWFGLPVRNGSSRIENTADGKRAIGTIGGQDFVSVEIKSVPDSCASAPVALTYPSPKGLIEIPVAGQACKAEPVSVKVHAPSGDPLGEFKPVKLLWAAEFKNGSFSISRPIPISQ